MKKIICVILCLLLSVNSVFAEEIARLYLVENENASNLQKVVLPAFNKLGYNLIKDNEYYVYENPAKNVYNVVVLKNIGSDCYYYYLSSEGLDFNKTILVYMDKYMYPYKRIKNSAYLELFYNDATDFLAKSRSHVKTVSDNQKSLNQQQISTNDEYDFSDEAQERFNNGGYLANKKTQQQITPSNVLVGSLLHIEAGTQFNAVLSSGISSESIANNDRISAQLMEDWNFNGVTVAPAGSLVNGNVVDSRAAGFAMGNGRIGINFNEIITPEGKVIKLSTNKVYIVGDSSRTKAVAGRVASGVLGGLAVAAISMLFGCDAKTLIGGAAVGGALGTLSAISTKGEDVDVPEGTNLQIMLAEPMTVQPYTSL